MKTLVLDYDDYHWQSPENCLDTVKEMISRVPEIKISLFTPSLYHGKPLEADWAWCEETRELIKAGRIVLAVHGTEHETSEYENIDEAEAREKLLTAEKMFMNADLPFVRAFKAPHWQIGEGTMKALRRLGYSHAYLHEDTKHLMELETPVRRVFYNWNLLDAAPPEDVDVIIGHGHTHDVCGNGIAQTMERVLQFVEKSSDIQFAFVHEVMGNVV